MGKGVGMTEKKPKIDFSMLVIWTIIFTVGSFFLNPLIFSEKVPELIRLCCVVIGFLFFVGFVVSWLEWIVWWIKNKKASNRMVPGTQGAYTEPRLTITQDELCDGLLQFASKFTRGVVDKELSDPKSPFRKADRENFLHERLIMIFWLIDKCVSDPERMLMGLLHEKYFKSSGLMKNPSTAKAEVPLLMSRYKEYHEAWNNDKIQEQTVLASLVAKNILCEDAPVLNALVTLQLNRDILLLIKELRSFVDSFKLQEKQA